MGEGCYYFSYKDNLKLDWPEARTHCQSLGVETDLAVLDYLCNDYNHLANYLLGEGKAETHEFLVLFLLINSYKTLEIIKLSTRALTN